MKPFSFSQKFLLCLTAGLVAAMTVLRIGMRMGREHGFNPLLAAAPAGILFLTALCYPFIWQRKQEQAGPSSPAVWVPRVFWQGLLRYGIALDLAMFGFQKLFRLQFRVPMPMLDQPFSSMTGEEMSWAFYSHSYLYAVVIGGFQIIGSMLLVYDRTKLIGVFTLLPVMMNICLLNGFYGFEAGELVHAVVLFAGLSYLLFEEYPRLAALFLAPVQPAPVRIRGRGLRNAVRLSVLFLPLLLIAGFHFPKENPVIDGRYQVTRLWMNATPVDLTNCGDSVLRLIYFEADNHCSFLYNGKGKMRLGTFIYDEKAGRMRVSWYFPAGAADTLDAGIGLSPGGLS